MCRLFGLHSGRRPVRAQFWLLDAPDALVVQSCGNPDGFGIGTFEPDGTPDIDKAPVRAAGAELFAREAHDECSRTYVAHVRFASVGELTYENTHPFELDARLFAHNGVVGEIDGVDPSLLRGQTDSERLFAFLTQRVRAHGDDVGAGLRDGLRHLAEHVELYALNFVLTTADELWALRYPEHNELFLLERGGGPQLDDRSSVGMRVRSDEADGGASVVIASERMDDDPRWQPVQPGELIRVGSDLEVERELVLPDPPARPMLLAGRAAESQAQDLKTDRPG